MFSEDFDEVWDVEDDEVLECGLENPEYCESCQQEVIMPYGKGTYGSKRGRPSKKAKAAGRKNGSKKKR